MAGKHTESSVELGGDGIIRIVAVGSIDKTKTTQLIEKAQHLISQLHARKQPVLLLADMSHTGKIGPGARRIATKSFGKVSYDRIAIVGANSENRQMMGFFVQVIAKALHMKFFMSEEPAIRWLKRRRINLWLKTAALLMGSIACIILAVVWYRYIAPQLLRLPADFSYQASVISHDDFYDQQTASFSGVITSNATFSYKATGSHNGIADVRNSFDVRTTSGEKIFAVTRTYGIDPLSWMHVPGYGDHNRTGYLFAPPHLAKQDFTYWHINYDQPATMKYQDEETVLGLDAYRYAADYHADQTKNLTNLPEVGKTRGINLDINLQLWVEPETGYLVKYEDHTTAYYYDLASGKRLNPWNRFSNNYNFDSIAAQVQLAEKAKRRAIFFEITMPATLVVLAVALLVMGGVSLWRLERRRHSSQLALRVSSGIVSLTALVVVVGWITNNPWLTRLHPAFSAMHIITALSFMLVAVAMWLIVQKQQTVSRRLSIYVTLGLVCGLAVTYFLNREMADTVSRVLHLPSLLSISPVTPICFVFVASALVASLWPGRKASWVAQSLLGFVFVLATITVASYGFSLDYLYSVINLFRSMALHTAILFMVIVIGAFWGHPDWFVTKRIKKLSKSLLLAVAVLVIGLTLTGSVWQQSLASTTKQANIQFQSDSDSLQATVVSTLSGYIRALQGARGLFAASQEVAPDEWKAYVDGVKLPQNYPGMQGMGFARVMQSPGQLMRAPVTYIEPLDARNQRALGYDMASEPVRRAAMERARDSGEAAMTSKITLVQETTTDQQAGLLIYLPVYKNGAPIATLEQRRSALVGYVYTPIRATDFMRATIGEQTHGLNVGLFDTTTPTHLTLTDRMYILNKQYGIENLNYKPRFVAVDSLPVAGHTLTVRYSSLPTYDIGVAQTLPAYVLFSGIVVSILLAGLTLLLSSSRNRALKLADDMTVDLRQERDAAITNEQKEVAILGGINEGLIVFDRNGRIEKVNEATQTLLGYTEDELRNKPYQTALVAFSSKGVRLHADQRPIASVLQRHKSIINVDLNYQCKDDRILPVKLSVAPITLHGEIQGAIEIFRDVTREKQLEHMKDEFLSVASHELRTPMGAVRANLAMILSGDYGPVNAALREPLTDMKSSTIRLVELVNDLLDVARIEAGRMKFTLSEFALTEVLQTIVKSLAPLGKEKGIKLVFEAKEVGFVQADQDKVRQVLTNLIGNALKFTDKGTIAVTAEVQDTMIEVTVRDTGIGITPEDQKKLFSKFNQITSAQAGKPAGTGLGLYISRQIIQKMGGKLWIKASAAGQGSTFAFTLPRSQSSEAKQALHDINREAELHPNQK